MLSDQSFHDHINHYASWIGLTASAVGAKDIVQKTWKNKKMSKGGLVTLVIWGSLLFNNSELNKANVEIANRSQLKSSSFY